MKYCLRQHQFLVVFIFHCNILYYRVEQAQILVQELRCINTLLLYAIISADILNTNAKVFTSAYLHNTSIDTFFVAVSTIRHFFFFFFFIFLVKRTSSVYDSLLDLRHWLEGAILMPEFHRRCLYDPYSFTRVFFAKSYAH